MTELLMFVGVFVFFISVYGAVMVGGYLLEVIALEEADDAALVPGSLIDPPPKVETTPLAKQ